MLRAIDALYSLSTTGSSSLSSSSVSDGGAGADCADGAAGSDGAGSSNGCSGGGCARRGEAAITERHAVNMIPKARHFLTGEQGSKIRRELPLECRPIKKFTLCLGTSPDRLVCGALMMRRLV